MDGWVVGKWVSKENSKSEIWTWVPAWDLRLWSLSILIDKWISTYFISHLVNLFIVMCSHTLYLCYPSNKPPTIDCCQLVSINTGIQENSSSKKDLSQNNQSWLIWCHRRFDFMLAGTFWKILTCTSILIDAMGNIFYLTFQILCSISSLGQTDFLTDKAPVMRDSLPRRLKASLQVQCTLSFVHVNIFSLFNVDIA